MSLLPWSSFKASDTGAALSWNSYGGLALLFLKLHGQGFSISLVLFGFYCLLIGYLIFRSTFLPRILGVLMAFAGLGYLINSFANFLSPPLANYLASYVLAPGLLGEGSLTVWLLVAGVNEQRWNDQASAVGDW